MTASPTPQHTYVDIMSEVELYHLRIAQEGSGSARSNDHSGVQLACCLGSAHSTRSFLKKRLDPCPSTCSTCSERVPSAGLGTWWAMAAPTTPTCTPPRWRLPCGARTSLPTRSVAWQARRGGYPGTVGRHVAECMGLGHRRPPPGARNLWAPRICAPGAHDLLCRIPWCVGKPTLPAHGR